NRSYFRNRHFGNALELIHHLLSFKVELGFIVDMLPFAATTYPEMFTKRRNTLCGKFMEFDHFRLHKTAFATGHPYIHQVSRSNVAYKYHLTLIMFYTFPFSINPFHPKVF